MNIGDKVVYIQRDLPEIGLIKNNIYTVFGIKDCNCKNVVHIDVGIMLPKGAKFSVCNDCMSIVSMDDMWYFHQEGFRLLEKPGERQLSISETKYLTI